MIISYKKSKALTNLMEKRVVVRARLVCVFKNWKLLFKNIYGNTCGWKNVLKCVKCCLKTENSCLKTQTKHPLKVECFFFFFPQLWDSRRMLNI